MRALALFLLLAACRGGADAVMARGVLAYDVAVARGRPAWIELSTEFTLVLDGGARRVRLGDPTYDVVDLALAADGTTAAVACLDGTVRVHDGRTGAERSRWRLDAAATAVALSADGRFLLTGSASGVLCLRRLSDGALFQCVDAHEGRIAALAARPGRLASAAWDGGIALWEIPSLRRLAAHQLAGAANAVAFSPDGETIAVATSRAPPVVSPASMGEGRAVLWRWRPGWVVPLPPHRGASIAVVFTPRGRLVEGAWDGALRVFSAAGGQVERRDGLPARLRGLAGWPLFVAAWPGSDPSAPAVVRVELDP